MDFRVMAQTTQNHVGVCLVPYERRKTKNSIILAKFCSKTEHLYSRKLRDKILTCKRPLGLSLSSARSPIKVVGLGYRVNRQSEVGHFKYVVTLTLIYRSRDLSLAQSINNMPFNTGQNSILADTSFYVDHTCCLL